MAASLSEPAAVPTGAAAVSRLKLATGGSGAELPGGATAGLLAVLVPLSMLTAEFRSAATSAADCSGAFAAAVPGESDAPRAVWLENDALSLRAIRAER